MHLTAREDYDAKGGENGWHKCVYFTCFLLTQELPLWDIVRGYVHEADDKL